MPPKNSDPNANIKKFLIKTPKLRYGNVKPLAIVTLQESKPKNTTTKNGGKNKKK